jgi:hypothetical protein
MPVKPSPKIHVTKDSDPSTEADCNTLLAYFHYMSPRHSLRAPLRWPPDVFAFAGALLLNSGAYRHAMSDWPPRSGWQKRTAKIAAAWRHRWNNRKAPPPEVQSLWRIVVSFGHVDVTEIVNHRELCVALIELCAIADEASFSLGIPPVSKTDVDPFYAHATDLLSNESGATLCEAIHPAKARVLPKMHTPQSGLTFRSFSLHLALYLSSEMNPKWATVPRGPAQHKLKLLLIPWPFLMKKSCFSRVRGELKMPGNYGFFEYTPSALGVEAKTIELLRRAVMKFGQIDGVVFPELALTQSQYLKISQIVLSKSCFLIAGVASEAASSSQRRNRVHFDLPFANEFHAVRLRQGKHHRWRLDRAQVQRYGLTGRLGKKSKFLWEHIQLEDRCLYFVTIRPWLTISVLICEDLARPDPVGDVVRAVGPNLVIALLLDGPQLSCRWSARYAAALADDPGSSVLTLTSTAMANLSCPSGKKDAGYKVVALWRDGGSGITTNIKIPDSKEAAVVTINVKEKIEFTADGRSDFGSTGYPILEKCDFV